MVTADIKNELTLSRTCFSNRAFFTISIKSYYFLCNLYFFKKIGTPCNIINYNIVYNYLLFHLLWLSKLFLTTVRNTPCL